MTIAGAFALFLLSGAIATFAARYVVAQLYLIPDSTTQSRREWMRRSAPAIRIGFMALVIVVAFLSWALNLIT